MNTQLKAFIYFMAPILMIAFVIMSLSPLTSNVSIAPPESENTPVTPNKHDVAVASVWDGTNTTPSGAGTEASPYIIDTAAKLAWISARATSSAYNKYYKQTVDIDLNNLSWKPINRTDTARTYYYDGGGYSISNLEITSTTYYNGLFGYITGGYIKNVHIVSGSVNGTTQTGGVVGCATSVTIENCVNSSTVTGTGHVGGVVGRLTATSSGGSAISNCINSGTITNSGICTGGIVGYCLVATESITITNCANIGNVICTDNSSNSHGGLAGRLSGISSIKDSFSTGKVQGGMAASTGGIIGDFWGTTSVTSVINCYYNTETVSTGTRQPDGVYGSGQNPTTSTNVAGLTTAEMLCPSNNTLPTGMTAFTASQWHLTVNNYPTLRLLASIELVVT